MANNEVSDNLKKLAKELDTTYIKQAMAEACAIVRNDAINLAPHDTGALQRSIDFEVSPEGTEGVIFSNLEYAPYVEVGTGIYATKGGGRDTPWSYKSAHGWHTTKGMRAQPFMEPALQQNTTKIIECFEDLL